MSAANFQLSRALELERYISLTEVAKLRGVSEDTIKRDPKLSKKIVQISKRRVAMKVKHALDLGDVAEPVT